MALKTKVVSAVRWTTMAGTIRAVLHIIQLSILARILSPEDYGLMAIVTVILVFTGTLSDMGLNSAYMQRQEVSHRQRSSLYWLNLIVSAFAALAVILASPVAAAFFGDPRLTSLIMLAASTLFIDALGQQLRVAAEKQLEFGPVISIEIVASLVGLSSALIAAFSGMGVYSLVIGSIVVSSICTVCFWVFLSRGWLPAFRFAYRDIRPFLPFGGAFVANALLRRASANVDLLIGGRMFGANELGLYSVPRNITMQIQLLVNPVVTRVGFPLISQVQDDLRRVKRIYLATLNMTSSTNAPIFVGAAFFSAEVLNFLLGSGWAASVEFFRVFAAWALLRSSANTLGGLLMGLGKANWALSSNIVLLVFQIPFLLYGARHGPIGVVSAMLCFQIIVFVPRWYLLIRPLLDCSLLEYSLAALKPIFLALIAVIPAFLIADQLEQPLLRLAVGMVLAAPGYLGLSALFNRVWVTEMLNLLGISKSPERTPS